MCPEIYEGWKNDPSTNQILTGLGLGNLPENLQVLVESLVHNPYRNSRKKKQLADELHIKPHTVTRALETLNNALSGQRFNIGAVDPQAVQRDYHFKGNDRGTRGTK